MCLIALVATGRQVQPVGGSCGSRLLPPMDRATCNRWSADRAFCCMALLVGGALTCTDGSPERRPTRSGGDGCNNDEKVATIASRHSQQQLN